MLLGMASEFAWPLRSIDGEAENRAHQWMTLSCRAGAKSISSLSISSESANQAAFAGRAIACRFRSADARIRSSWSTSHEAQGSFWRIGIAGTDSSCAEIDTRAYALSRLAISPIK